VTPGDARGLLTAVDAALADFSVEAKARSQAQAMLQRFNASRMTEAVIGFYATALRHTPVAA
jgi:hypothetical protein